uniref:Peptidase A1 domain-containing protein n=1 Tax=Mesocestoides corti TaxID=53468 RepID=A0A5K3F2K5_MESCO
MTDKIRLDIQRVQWMMESCLSKRPCTSRTTQFYVVGNRNRQYNTTIAYPQSTPSNRNVLFFFRLSAAVLDLNVTTCIERQGIFQTHRTFGPIGFSRVVLEAGVVVDTRGRLRFRKNLLAFGDSLAYPVNIDNRDYQSLVQMFAAFIDEKC